MKGLPREGHPTCKKKKKLSQAKYANRFSVATHEGNSRKDLQRLHLKESARYKSFNVPRASEQPAKSWKSPGVGRI